MLRLTIAAALLAGTALAAQAQALPDRVKTAGKIIIATQPNYPPITFKDVATNQLSGFDIELGEAIAKELGIKVEWQETAFAQLLSSLQTGRVDAVMAGKSVGASRATNWPRQIGEWSAANCVAKGKPAVNVVETEGSVDARTQLKTQRLQGGVQGSETMSHFQKLEPNTYIPLGKPF